MGKRDNKITDIVSKAEHELLKRYMNPSREASKDAMKKIRKHIVDAWFAEYDSVDMNGATFADAHAKIVDGKTLVIDVSTWVDPLAYENGQSIVRWNERRGVWGSSEDAIRYMLDLQFEQGVIGLPKRGTRRVPEENRWAVKKHLDSEGFWHNPFFCKRPNGLREEIITNARWTDGTFVSVFGNILRKGVK